MSERWGWTLLVGVLLLGVAFPGAAVGQWGGDGTLGASGTASLERMPETMRLQIEIPARGDDLKQALTKLGEKREAAAKKLAEIGVPEGAVKFDDPRITEGKLEKMRQMMMRGQIEEEEEAEEKEEEKPSRVSVSTALKVEWPLKEGSVEDLLLQVHDLRKKLEAADLAGLKDDKPTPEEEEMLAEMEDEAGRYSSYGEEQVEPGQLTFLFVSKISEADRAKLMSEAFGKAKAEAGRLAAAAGVELGPLAGLGSSRSEGYSPYEYNSRYYQVMQQARTMYDPEQMQDEAVGVEPTKISYRLTVSAAYKIK